MADLSEKRRSIKLGVVIVNFINYRLTISFIKDQLLVQDFPIFRIVIVDNSSPNESVEAFNREFNEYQNINIISNSKNSGFGTGNNIGIKYLESIGCEFILISNNDIEISDRQLLSKLIRKYQEINNIAFISPLIFTNGVVKNEYTAWKLPDRLKELLSSSYLLKIAGNSYLRKFHYSFDLNSEQPMAVDCLPGSFFLGSVEVFKRIHYFDENIFLYYEETIIGQKVKSTGLQNFVLSSLSCNHQHAKTIDLIFNPFQKYGKLLSSRIYYWTAYRKAGKLFALTLTFLFFILTMELVVSLPLRYILISSKRLKD